MMAGSERTSRSALRNDYFLLRHGESQANCQQLIISSPESGIDSYGLSELGLAEVTERVRERQSELNRVTKICSSDFLRTRQTAEIAAGILRAPVEYSQLLRERFFGQWEGTCHANYQQVWQADAEDATHQRWNVESVRTVAERMKELIEHLEATSASESYLLVSHGDPLQILMTSYCGRDLREHRQLNPIGTAEIRLLGDAI